MAEQVLNTVMVPVEECAELRAAADLLARVRAECRVSLTNNGFLRLHIDADDEGSDLLRELVEALTHGPGRSVIVLGERQ